MKRRNIKTHHWVRIKPPTDDEIAILKLANMVKMPRETIRGHHLSVGFVFGIKHKHGRGFTWWRYEKVEK